MKLKIFLALSMIAVFAVSSGHAAMYVDTLDFDFEVGSTLTYTESGNSIFVYEMLMNNDTHWEVSNTFDGTTYDNSLITKSSTNAVHSAYDGGSPFAREWDYWLDFTGMNIGDNISLFGDDYEIMGQEEVTVTAGTYTAWKIVTTNDVRHYDVSTGIGVQFNRTLSLLEGDFRLEVLTTYENAGGSATTTTNETTEDTTTTEDNGDTTTTTEDNGDTTTTDGGEPGKKDTEESDISGLVVFLALPFLYLVKRSKK